MGEEQGGQEEEKQEETSFNLSAGAVCECERDGMDTHLQGTVQCTVLHSVTQINTLLQFTKKTVLRFVTINCRTVHFISEIKMYSVSKKLLSP